MSISFKKINKMVEEVVDADDDLDKSKKETLIDLCQRIYQIESSIGQTSNSQLIGEIRGEVQLRSMGFRIGDNDEADKGDI